jgi:hypothetical protein
VPIRQRHPPGQSAWTPVMVVTAWRSVHRALRRLLHFPVVRGRHLSAQLCKDGLHRVVAVPVPQGGESLGINLHSTSEMSACTAGFIYMIELCSLAVFRGVLNGHSPFANMALKHMQALLDDGEEGSIRSSRCRRSVHS